MERSVRDVLPSLRSTVDLSGGLSRERLVEQFEALAGEFGLAARGARTFAATELDLVSAGRHLGLSVQAGRAHTNHGGVMAVLAAASAEDVDWLILVVPERYKGTTTSLKVLENVQAIAASTGMRLSLDGVVVIDY